MAPVSCCYHVATDPADVSRGLFSQSALALDLERSNRVAVLPGAELGAGQLAVHQRGPDVSAVVVPVVNRLHHDDPRGHGAAVATPYRDVEVGFRVQVRAPV